jgi:hypothetical protein
VKHFLRAVDDTLVGRFLVFPQGCNLFRDTLGPFIGSELHAQEDFFPDGRSSCISKGLNPGVDANLSGQTATRASLSSRIIRVSLMI